MTEWMFWGTISLLTFALSIAVLLIVIVQLPNNYFTKLFGENDNFVSPSTQYSKLLSFTLKFVRNIFGLILLLAGVAMLFLPGQGLLTILLGISLIDFPGKKRLLRWLFKKLNYVRLIGYLNRLRSFFNRPALHLPTRHTID